VYRPGLDPTLETLELSCRVWRRVRQPRHQQQGNRHAKCDAPSLTPAPDRHLRHLVPHRHRRTNPAWDDIGGPEVTFFVTSMGGRWIDLLPRRLLRSAALPIMISVGEEALIGGVA